MDCLNQQQCTSNSFFGLLQTVNTDFHAYTSLGITKGNEHGNDGDDKTILITNVTDTINGIDTSHFGVRVIIIKMKE